MRQEVKLTGPDHFSMWFPFRGHIGIVYQAVKPPLAVETRAPVAYSGNMRSTEAPPTNVGSLLRRLLTCLSYDWLSLLLDVYRYVQQVSSRQQAGMYEILDYDATLELLDAQGATAVFRKRQKVKFRQDNIIAFEDFAWGDGQTMAAYRCSPGVVVDRYREGDRWNVLISLRETRNRGDVVEFQIERKVKNGFTKAEEWQQAEIRHRTHRLQMAVIFPISRPCQRATVSQRSRHHVLVLGPEHFRRLPDGRQKVTWETDRVHAYDVYTLKWVW